MNKVLIRKQNQDFKIALVDDLSLEYMQEVVGGFIERVSFIDPLDELNIDMWANDEGKLIDGLKPTFVVLDNKDKLVDIIMGDTIFTSRDRHGNTIGLNDMQIKIIKNHFKTAAILNDGTIANVIKI